MRKILIALSILFSFTTLAQVRELTPETIAFCTSGDGNDSYYTLELYSFNNGNDAFASTSRIADGRQEKVDLVSVSKNTGPTGVLTYVNSDNNYSIYFVKTKKGQLTANITDSRGSAITHDEFEDCELY